jgi:hypothetical protein
MQTSEREDAGADHQEVPPIEPGTVVKDTLSGRTGVLDRYEDDGAAAVLRTGDKSEFTALTPRLIVLGNGGKPQTS